MKKNVITPLLFALLSTQVHAAIDNNTTQSAAPESAFNCTYHIPTDQKVDPAQVTNWATKATLQSFTFTPSAVQNELDSLKACYTEQGWKGFSDALQKSGNIDSIKTQQLNVSSQADGEANMNLAKDEQWKVTLPISVVYQNDKEKVTQKLIVGVLVGRKPNGDLGIMQLLATTRVGANALPQDKVAPQNAGTPELGQPAGAPASNNAPAATVPSSTGPNPSSEPAAPAAQ